MSFARALPELLLVDLGLGLDRDAMTGFGNSICSSTIGCWWSQIVSPVATLLSPTAAAMSPG